jgi:hypothetical protein
MASLSLTNAFHGLSGLRIIPFANKDIGSVVSSKAKNVLHHLPV